MKRFGLIAIALVSAVIAFAQNTFVSGDLNFKIEGNGVVLMSATRPQTNLRIPTMVSHNGVKYPVTGIARGAFYNHQSLLTVSFGAYMKSIGDGAFFGCQILEAVYCYAVVPPVSGGRVAVFGFESNGQVVVNQKFAVFVPSGAIADYQQAPLWKDLPLQPIVAEK